MIEFVEGVLEVRSPSTAVVKVGGVGFHCLVSLSTYDDLPPQGSETRLWTHLTIRDEQPVLFGFSTLEERWLFRQLITVNGVGPRLAITILSGARTTSIRDAVVGGDSDRLKTIRGIGAKTADRIVLELKKKLSEGSPIGDGEAVTSEGNEVRQAMDALAALGFSQNEARKAVESAAKRGAGSVEALIKESLRKS